jgi:glucokinase
VARLAAAGDGLASQVWAEAIEALADGLVIAQTLFDAELIVVGGGLAGAGEQLLAPLRDAIRARITFHREPEIARAAFGDEAGCLGSALLALELVDAAR